MFNTTLIGFIYWFLDFFQWFFDWLYNFYQGIGIIHIVVFAFFLLYAKYTSIRSDFGARIVTGAMWVWKSFTVFLQTFKKKKNAKIKPFIIWNIPFSHVDLFYQSMEDFDKICAFFVRYMNETNDIWFLKQNFQRFRPVILIMDEAHLYFFSTDTIAKMWKKGTWERYRTLFTQLRKRNVTAYFITQVYAQVLSFLRRLVPFVTYLTNALWFLRIKRWLFVKKDETDLRDKNIADNQPWQFRFFRHPALYFFLDKEFSSQHYLSHYCVNLDNHQLLDYDYEQFKASLPLISDEEINQSKPKIKKIFDYIYKKTNISKRWA